MVGQTILEILFGSREFSTASDEDDGHLFANLLGGCVDGKMWLDMRPQKEKGFATYGIVQWTEEWPDRFQ